MTRIISIFIFALYTLINNCIYAQQCNFIQVSSKSSHSLGITNDGKLYGWGSNGQGQLGLGATTVSEPIPKLVNQDNDWKKVETGQNSFYSVGLKNNGSLWLWGGNFNNSLGNYTNHLLPVQIATNFNCKDFSTGYWRIMALRDDNTLWGWGDNDGGCLGVGSTINIIGTPTQVGNDDNWTKVSSGLFHTLALKSNGTIWACGYNNTGQLGNGTSGNGTFSEVFVQVGSENNWNDILACAGFNLAIKTDGTLWAWGNNETGQIGDGTTINKLVPTQIGTDTDWKSLGYSGYSAAAIKANGTLWTWGLGAQGQLGNGSTLSASVPTQIGTDMDWEIVTGGGGYGFAGTTADHYLALKQNNELYSWGINLSGALGNNTTNNVNVPTSICNTVSSVELLIEEDVSIFPNPTNNIIHVESESQIKNLTVLNIFGQEIKKQANSKQVDISGFENGTYLLKIEMVDRGYVIKIVSIIR